MSELAKDPDVEILTLVVDAKLLGRKKIRSRSLNRHSPGAMGSGDKEPNKEEMKSTRSFVIVFVHPWIGLPAGRDMIQSLWNA